ncbi:MAG: hypothetical protein IJR26_05905 [Bacteroidales bacterium]|nr:hypothetical protein [Bacteroidales bacterium]
MKNIFIKTVLLALLFSSTVGTAVARECTTCKKSTATKTAVQSKAAECKRAQSTAELNVNNVRALINGYGNMWYDGSISQYHIPKDGTSTPLYCAALWIGGTDVNDQLRIAALRFGQDGDDYWPGPLALNSAEVTRKTCNDYDRHFKITQAEVLNFMSQFDYTGDQPVLVADELVIPSIIKDWPAHPIDWASNNQSRYLAPFFDADGDGAYKPENGDYPYYDFDNKLCPRTLKANLKPGENYVPYRTMEDSLGIVNRGTGLLSDQVLKGDQTNWWVFNDMGNTHTESKGQPIGLEIRAQAFAFSTNDEINNMTFYSYEIINRSTYELKNTYFSQWVDPDLGYGYDDYIGCDVKRGLGYCYNGDGEDGPGTGSFSGTPPAVGIDFFQGPYMDPDGQDNPKIDIDKMRVHYPEKLANYLLADGVNYDTISLTDDADLYYPLAWYFQKDDSIGNCAINGVNFGNNIIDDERFGMRRFVYYENSSNSINGEPSKATDYYNYLKGFWKNGQHMKYGGNAISAGTTDLDCDFMFPDDSDPLHWGTNGVVPDKNPDDWTEVTSGTNVTPGDRRFMQSAGPFTLKPGAVNYITVGIPFAQATDNNPWSSVGLLREIDDVCQALFENCFKVLDGPDAPTLVVQEMSNEVLLYITYENPASNNYGEKYDEEDASILKSYPDDLRHYKFEGYQVYQLADANASVADIGDETKARLVFQCDVENYYDAITRIDTIALPTGGFRYDTTFNDNPILGIGRLVNYTQNSSTGLLTGKIMVDGANAGIQHVVRVNIDRFATGTNTALVNNKEYYYIAVAYAHNRYKEYSQTDPTKLDGQKEPYLAGRKNEYGGLISPVVAVPHDPASENGGTIIQATYGLCPNITRIEGYGNGGSVLRITDESIASIMGDSNVAPTPYRGVFNSSIGGLDLSTMGQNPAVIQNPRYEQNAGPINVRVIDPLNVKQGQFYIKFNGYDDNAKWVIENADTTKPLFVRTTDFGSDTVWSDTADFTISRYNEQLFLDLGIAVAITNPKAVATNRVFHSSKKKIYGGLVNDGVVLSATMNFQNPEHQWLSGIYDDDAYPFYNWIRSGIQFAANSVEEFIGRTTALSAVDETYLDEDFYKEIVDDTNQASTSRVETGGIDKYQVFEKVLGGTWAPYGLTSFRDYHPAFSFHYYQTPQNVLDSLRSAGFIANTDASYYGNVRRTMEFSTNKSLMFNDLSKLPSVRVVITKDTSKWTRCPVIEMCDDYTQSEGNARRFQLRKHHSIDKFGDTTTAESNYINSYGMGWFPGYVINLSTGERLNIIYGEDSRYVQYNGRDMMWNPVSTEQVGAGNYVIGGRHYIYILNAMTQMFPRFHVEPQGASNPNFNYRTPSYDGGEWARKMLSSLDHFFECPYTNPADVKKYYQNFNQGLIKHASSTYVVPIRDSAAFLFSTVSWVNMPIARETINNPAYDIPTTVTIDLNVNNRYGNYYGNNATNTMRFDDPVTHTGRQPLNGNNPMYMFELTENEMTLTNQAVENARESFVDSILEAIYVVPNPYYSYSAYETKSQLETKVRFINVPERSKITIYTVDGTLVRTLSMPEGSTTIDWDLHNATGIPIAGGLYLIHFNCPGIGERVVKWFGTMRPVDMSGFQF